MRSDGKTSIIDVCLEFEAKKNLLNDLFSGQKLMNLRDFMTTDLTDLKKTWLWSNFQIKTSKPWKTWKNWMLGQQVTPVKSNRSEFLEDCGVGRFLWQMSLLISHMRYDSCYNQNALMSMYWWLVVSFIRISCCNFFIVHRTQWHTKRDTK